MMEEKEHKTSARTARQDTSFGQFLDCDNIFNSWHCIHVLLLHGKLIYLNNFVFLSCSILWGLRGDQSFVDNNAN